MITKRKLSGELLVGNLENVSSLIGEARSVADILAKRDLPMERVKELGKQTSGDLAGAAELLDGIIGELVEAERSSN